MSPQAPDGQSNWLNLGQEPPVPPICGWPTASSPTARALVPPMSKPVLQVSPLAVVVISDPTLPSSVPLLSLASQQLATQLTTPPFSILSSLDVSDAILAWLSPDPGSYSFSVSWLVSPPPITHLLLASPKLGP